MTDKPPTYLPIILHPLVRLASLDADIRAKVVNEGLSLETDSYGYSCVRFDDVERSDLKNISLIELLMQLNELGVVFGEDYKQLCSPAGLMRDLQQEGILRVAFKSIAFGIKKQGDWQVTENLPNQLLHRTQ